ncbi:MAG: hypothetical protein AAF495_25950 [Pseudomonadota bacterium]
MTQQKAKMSLMFLVVLTGLTSAIPAADAKMVQIFDRYFADSSTIVGRFYKNENQPITFEISFATGLAGRRFEIVCPGQEWSRRKIIVATRAFVRAINNSTTIRVFEILYESGLVNCSFKT